MIVRLTLRRLARKWRVERDGNLIQPWVGLMTRLCHREPRWYVVVEYPMSGNGQHNVSIGLSPREALRAARRVEPHAIHEACVRGGAA